MDSKSLKDQLEAHTGIRLSHCYQCGKCAGGCPVAEEMDVSPCQVLRLLQMGQSRLDQRVLTSEGIWLCLGCETCVTRCPQEVDLPKVMDFVRQQAVALGVAHPRSRNILAFHRSFLQSIEHTGRLYEIGLVAGYKLRTRQFMKDVALAPRMYAKGKLGLLPHLIKDRAGMRRLFKRALGGE